MSRSRRAENRFSLWGACIRGIVPLLRPKVYPRGSEDSCLRLRGVFKGSLPSPEVRERARRGSPRNRLGIPLTSSEGSLKNSFYFLDEVQILVAKSWCFFNCSWSWEKCFCGQPTVHAELKLKNVERHKWCNGVVFMGWWTAKWDYCTCFTFWGKCISTKYQIVQG